MGLWDGKPSDNNESKSVSNLMAGINKLNSLSDGEFDQLKVELRDFL